MTTSWQQLLDWKAEAEKLPRYKLSAHDAPYGVYGAHYKTNRYGFGGAWTGYDYFDANDRLVVQTMAACGNPL